jgi:probable O-glycosylation ligase (exosortase A-associated)
MNPHRLSWGFAYEFPFAQVIAIVTIFAFIISREKKSIEVSPILVLWGIYFFWTCVTTVFAIYPELAMNDIKQFTKITFMALLSVFLINSKLRLNHLVWIIVLSFGFFGVKGGIFTILTGGSSKVWGPADSFIEDNNALALALIMTLPLMRYLHLNAKNAIIKFGLLGVMLLTAVAVLGTQSRGGMLGLVAMVIFLVLKSRHRALFGMLIIISAFTLYNFMPPSWHDRMASISNYEKDQSAQGRIRAWVYSYRLAKERPLVGGGFSPYSEEQYKRLGVDASYWQGAHSIYFQNLAEHGFIGLALFLILGFAVFRRLSKIIKVAKKNTEMYWARDLAAMMQVSMFGYAISGTFLELAGFDYIYQIVAMTMILATLVKRHEMKLNSKEVGEYSNFSDETTGLRRT